MDLDHVFKEVKIKHIVFMYVISLVISTVLTFVIIKSSNVEINDSTINIVILFNEILITLMLIYKLDISKETVLMLINDFKKKIDMHEIIYIVIMNVLISIGGSNIILTCMYLISPDLASEFAAESPIIINGYSDYIFCSILLVVLAPIVEELIFRHVLFKRIMEKFNIYVGIFVSSIIFSSLNAGIGMIGALEFGIVSCFLYIKYKNILMPILMHLINNLLAITAFFKPSEYSGNLINIQRNSVAFNTIVGIIICTIGIILLIRFIRLNKKYLLEIN